MSSIHADVAKELMVAAIEKGLVLNATGSGKTPEDINKATAQSIAEMYDIVLKSVLKTHRP